MDKCRKSMCNAIAKFDKNMINILKQYIPKHMGYENEVAGPLYLEHEHNNTYIVKINKNSVNEGNGKEVDQINSRYNFHSHPEAAYILYNCDIGWPSRDDFVTFLDGFFKDDTLFHLVASVEGIYILKVNPCIQEAIKKYYNTCKSREKFIDEIDQWVEDHINISKQNVKINSGVGKTLLPRKYKNYISDTDDGLIKTPQQYIDFVRNVDCQYIGKFKPYESMPLFDIEFIEWNQATTTSFVFTQPNKNNKCIIKLK